MDQIHHQRPKRHAHGSRHVRQPASVPRLRLQLQCHHWNEAKGLLISAIHAGTFLVRHQVDAIFGGQVWCADSLAILVRAFSGAPDVHAASDHLISDEALHPALELLNRSVPGRALSEHQHTTDTMPLQQLGPASKRPVQPSPQLQRAGPSFRQVDRGRLSRHESRIGPNAAIINPAPSLAEGIDQVGIRTLATGCGGSDTSVLSTLSKRFSERYLHQSRARKGERRLKPEIQPRFE